MLDISKNHQINHHPKPAITKGIGFGGNLKTGKYRFGIEYPSLKIKRTPEGICSMQNREVLVMTMDHNYKALKRPILFPCPEISPTGYPTGPLADGYDTCHGAYSPSNDALYAGTILSNLYKDWYSLPVLMKKDGKTPMRLTLRVHYGRNFQVAYWDGKQSSFGDGDESLYPLVSLGIVAHEVSHGFTQQQANLTFRGEPGGINEAFSDMASQAAQFYTKGEVNWIIGEEVIKPEHQPKALQYHQIRYMDKPSKDGKSFDTATEYYAAAEKDSSSIPVYAISGVYNHLFYFLATQPRWNVHQAFDVMVAANRFYWGPYDNFILDSAVFRRCLTH